MQEQQRADARIDHRCSDDRKDGGVPQVIKKALLEAALGFKDLCLEADLPVFEVGMQYSPPTFHLGFDFVFQMMDASS
jgi:hypothetical protein